MTQPYNPGNAWWLCDGREVRLAELWERSTLSAREIGMAMGKTKNAVIGKARRLGLEPRGPLRIAAPQRTIEFPAGGCLYGFGDVSDPEFRFCGAPVARPSEAWCREHRAIVYQRERPAV